VKDLFMMEMVGDDKALAAHIRNLNIEALKLLKDLIGRLMQPLFLHWTDSKF
jgi:hypothetical protein